MKFIEWRTVVCWSLSETETKKVIINCNNSKNSVASTAIALHILYVCAPMNLINRKINSINRICCLSCNFVMQWRWSLWIVLIGSAHTTVTTVWNSVRGLTFASPWIAVVGRVKFRRLFQLAAVWNKIYRCGLSEWHILHQISRTHTHRNQLDYMQTIKLIIRRVFFPNKTKP